MNPRVELLQILQGKKVTSGTVVSINKGEAVVSTASGPITVVISTQTYLRKGDKVAIRGGVVTSRLKQDDEVPHFVV